MGYECKVIADSVSPWMVRLTTMQVTFPRIVLAEFNTHRVFSRNSASSRAIPVERRIASVEADPFIPEKFGRNRRGMQAKDDLEDFEDREARGAWEHAIEDALKAASRLADVGVHKQLANRLLEPFCWQTVVVTATEWSNFFALRCSPLAQPEIRKPAEMMRAAMQASEPVPNPGWHLPYVDFADEVQMAGLTVREIAMVSAARCARVSYLTQEGTRDALKDLELARSLEANGHMSPFEHPAKCWSQGPGWVEWSANFRGWEQLRKSMEHEADFSKRPDSIL